MHYKYLHINVYYCLQIGHYHISLHKYLSFCSQINWDSWGKSKRISLLSRLCSIALCKLKRIFSGQDLHMLLEGISRCTYYCIRIMKAKLDTYLLYMTWLLGLLKSLLDMSLHIKSLLYLQHKST